MELSLKDLQDINKYFNDYEKESIIDKLQAKKKEEKIYEDIDKLEKYIKENNKCNNLKRKGIYLLGDFIYKYDNHKDVSIDIINESSVELRIDSYCYSTDSVEDLLRVLPDIHIAVDRGII